MTDTYSEREKSFRHHTVMKDKYGEIVKQKRKCLFNCIDSKFHEQKWITGTVRSVAVHTYFHPEETVWEAHVDDGDPSNPDLLSNNFRVSMYVLSHNIEMIYDRQK